MKCALCNARLDGKSNPLVYKHWFFCNLKCLTLWLDTHDNHRG